MIKVARPMPPRLAIRAMAAAIPETSQTVAEAAAELGMTPVQTKMFGRLFGLRDLPIDPDQSLPMLLMQALSNLADKAPDDVARARYVMHCHTIPNVRLPGPGIDIALPEAAEAMSVTMAHCASGLLALDLLDVLLNPGQTAVILVGEKAFHPRVRVIEDTTIIIMSEGAVAVLVTAGPGRWQVRGTHVTHAGQFALSRGYPDEEPELTDNYVGFVADHITDALTRLDCAPEDLKMILPHNVNMVSWANIAKALDLPMASIFTRNIPRLGHCFGADPFLNLISADEEPGFAPGDRILCVSVGMGMSAASTLIEIPTLTEAPTL